MLFFFHLFTWKTVSTFQIYNTLKQALPVYKGSNLNDTTNEANFSFLHIFPSFAIKGKYLNVFQQVLFLSGWLLSYKIAVLCFQSN